MYLRREVSVKLSGESECNVVVIFSVTAFMQPYLSVLWDVYSISVRIFHSISLMMAVVGDDGADDSAYN